MKRASAVLTAAIACTLTSVALLQQGGDMTRRDDNAVRAAERALGTYLDGKEERTLVTPGEFSEWPLKLEVGQVVIAEARSEAFDPAMEVVDSTGKVMGENDDRYTGEQRPLLFWRCSQAGAYGLRVRSYHGKAGGQAFVRFKVYDCMDLGTDKPVDRDFTQTTRFLFRIPMKAGQIKQVFSDRPNDNFTQPFLRQTISPIGLPYDSLTRTIELVYPSTLLAPVDGDYYAVAEVYTDRKTTVRAFTRDIVAQNLERTKERGEVKLPTNTPSLRLVTVKAGELLEITTPELNVGAQIIYTEQPDISKFDLKKPETNPFYPRTADAAPVDGPAFVGLPARANDPRIAVFVAQRDTSVWLATNGSGEKDKTYSLIVRPAASDFAEGTTLRGKLRIGSTDYWAFEGKAGDVMTLSATTKGFAARIITRGPDLGETGRADATLDQTEFKWGLIIQRPGRYLEAISCIGEGGGGDYSLTRKVFHPKEFAKGTPAKGEISDGQTQVWKFTAKPGEPLYMHWFSSKASYSISVRNENGDNSSLPLVNVDGSHSFGVISVSRPTTYLLVLTSNGGKAQYSIELSDLPGYAKKK